MACCLILVLNKSFLFVPSTVSLVRVFRVESGCMKVVRVANEGVADASHSGSVEGQVLFDVFDVSVGNKSGLAETALALGVLALKQVALALFATEDFARTSDLEALGNGFPCLCFSGYSWHGAGNLGIRGPVAREKWGFLRNAK